MMRLNAPKLRQSLTKSDNFFSSAHAIAVIHVLAAQTSISGHERLPLTTNYDFNSDITPDSCV